MAKKKKDETTSESDILSEEFVEEVPEQAPEVETAKVSAHRKYRVVEDARCQIGRQVLTLKKGSIVNEQFYGGAEGVAKLKAQGVKMEEIS